MELKGYDAWKTRAPEDDDEGPELALCENCGDDVEGEIYSAGGAYAFCCTECYRAFVLACDEGDD